VLEEGIMDESWLDIMLSPERMTKAGSLGHEHSKKPKDEE